MAKTLHNPTEAANPNRRERLGLSGRFGSLRQDFRRHPVLVFLMLTLLLLIALGLYSGVQTIRAEYHLRAARRALERSDFPAAQAHLALCLELSPKSAEAHFLAAQTARRSGDYEAALDQLTECRRLGWSSEAIGLERALSRAQRGDLGQVEDYLLAGVDKAQPEAILILEALTQGYLKTYRLVDALHCLDLWLQRQPNNVRALIWRGEVKERRNSNAQAALAYRHAVEVEPDNRIARFHLAQVLANSDGAEEAQKDFEYLRRQQPNDPEVLFGLARCSRSLGKTDEARQLLDRVLAQDPGHNWKDSHNRLQAPGAKVFGLALGERAKLALQTESPEVAEEWLRKAAVKLPYDRDTLYNLYQCLLQRGKRTEAQAILGRVEKLAADRQLLAELTRRITASPKDPALRYQAGLICLRNGQEQEGIRWLQSALVQEPNHRLTHQALAKYYEGVGQKERAAYHRRWAKEN